LTWPLAEGVEDLDEPACVGAAHSDRHVLADFGRIVGMAVRAEDERPVGLQPSVGDPIAGTGRLGYALLV